MTNEPENIIPIGTKRNCDGKYLSDKAFQLLTDSQDINSALQFIPCDWKNDITALLVRSIDADSEEVWATESSRPFAASNDYYRIA